MNRRNLSKSIGSTTAAVSVVTAFAVFLLFPAAPVGKSTRLIVFQGGRIITAGGGTIRNGSVVVRGDRIIRVSRNKQAPPGALIVNIHGRVLAPGFIDIVTSLGLAEIWAVGSTVDGRSTENDPVRASFQARTAFNADSVVIPTARAGGVTSALAVPVGGLVSGQSAWIDLFAFRGHARIVRPALALHFQLGARVARELETSRGSAVEKIHELLDDALFYEKNKGDFEKRRLRKTAAGRRDLAALLEVLKGRRHAFFYANRASDIRAALAIARKYKIKALIVGGADAWRLTRELRLSRTPVILNPFHNLPRNFDQLRARSDTAAILDRAGVRVVISTLDAYDWRHRVHVLRQAAGNAVREGMKRTSALAAITIQPARALGMQGNYGSIAAGKMANLVVWSGDPLELSSRVEQMFISGRRVSLDNRQRALMRRYRTLPKRKIPPPLRRPD